MLLINNKNNENFRISILEFFNPSFLVIRACGGKIRINKEEWIKLKMLKKKKREERKENKKINEKRKMCIDFKLLGSLSSATCF